MKRIYPLLLFGFIITASTSCKKSSNNDNHTGRALVLTAVEQHKAEADNAFSFNLLKTVSQTSDFNKNLFISPLSVSVALGMTSNGSNGATLDSIYKALDFDGFTAEQVNGYYKKLLTDLPNLDPKTTLKIANSIWYRQGFSVLPQFLQTNQDNYGAAVQALNFNDPSAKSTINNWVSQQTSGKIPTIIDDAISDDLVMYLINAIYFKSVWKDKFDVKNTSKQSFVLQDNRQIQTDFMSGNIDFSIYRDTAVTVVELPYANDTFDAIIVLPSTYKPIQSVVANLNQSNWNNWMSKLTPTDHNTLMLPKFKFSYNIKLNNALSNLGMGVAFSDGADFTRINPEGGLKISEVKQKAFVEVNEDGTEAAAATSVGIILTSASGTSINRPFLFVIREKHSGLILFTGIINNPSLTGN
jgi:serpin B